jgi:hypothetical protein
MVAQSELETAMHLLISIFLIAGAFAIAGKATAGPVSPWFTRVKR